MLTSQSSSQCSPDADCPLQQLKAIQQRAASNKKYLANLSPFLTTTNDPFYPETSNYLLAYWGSQESDTDLRELDRIVRDIQKILNGAKKTRKDLLTSASQFNVILHSIRFLPDDILLLIFEWCTFSHFEHRYLSYGYGSLENEYPPWRLSHVCPRWRNLVLTSPRLWSVVYLPSSLFQRISREDTITSRLDLHLKRSRNTLLAVMIGDYEPCSYILQDKGTIVSLLRATTDRWRSLHIYTNGSGDNAADFLGSSFPVLACLEVKDTLDFDRDTHVVVTTFRHTPRLVDLKAHHTKLDLNWDNIVSCGLYANCLAVHSLLPAHPCKN